jgi:hypothetical protein
MINHVMFWSYLQSVKDYPVLCHENDKKRFQAWGQFTMNLRTVCKTQKIQELRWKLVQENCFAELRHIKIDEDQALAHDF